MWTATNPPLQFSVVPRTAQQAQTVRVTKPPRRPSLPDASHPNHLFLLLLAPEHASDLTLITVTRPNVVPHVP